MKRIFKCLLVVLLFVFLLVSAGLIFYSLHYNHRLRSEYKKDETAYPYAEMIENGDFDLTKVSELLPDAVAAMSHNWNNRIVISNTLSYYRNIGDAAPIYTIKAGSIVDIDFDANSWTRSGITYRGIKSLPTNKAGWRLVKPFSFEGEERIDDLLYVKSDELVGIIKDWIDENPKTMATLSRIAVEQGLMPTKYIGSRYIMLSLDRILYSKGVFMSFDLKIPVLSVAAIISLTVCIILLTTILLIKETHAK